MLISKQLTGHRVLAEPIRGVWAFIAPGHEAQHKARAIQPVSAVSV